MPVTCVSSPAISNPGVFSGLAGVSVSASSGRLRTVRHRNNATNGAWRFMPPILPRSPLFESPQMPHCRPLRKARPAGRSRDCHRPRALFAAGMPLTKAEITRLRSLQEKKHREALGLFVVEGEKVVGELLAAKFPFAEVYATEAVERDLRARFEPARRAGSTLIDVSSEEMERISHYPTPAAVLAVGKIARTPLAA